MRIFFKGVSIKFLVFIISCTISVTGQAQAVIGNWNFNNTLAGTGSTYNTVSAASLNSTITSSGYYNNTMYYGAGGWPTGAINTSAYLQFSLTPNAGYTLNISSLEIDMRRGTQNGQGPRSWSIRSSLDGFTADIASGSLNPNSSTETVTLNSTYNNLLSTITFRIYGYQSNGNANTFAFDNIAVRGLSILPTSFVSLTGKTLNEKVLLNWSIDENSSLNHFEIERSHDGANFTAVDKKYNANTTVYNYSDSKTGAGAYVWYRIKSVELNGTIKYSDILKIQVQQTNELSINRISISGGQIIIQANAAANGNAKMLLSTIDGKILVQQNITLSKGTQTIKLNQSNTSGIQVLTIVQNNQLISRQFVN